MSQLLDLIMQKMDGNVTRRIGSQIGANEQTTQAAIMTALPLLLAGLAKNSSSPDGARSLHGALSTDHDGSVLDNLDGLIGNAQTGPGAGILGHVLGEREPLAQQALSKASGLDTSRAGQLLMMLAPVVMGALGRAQRQRNLDAPALAGMLGNEQAGLRQSSPGLMGLATRLLDKDGDGSIADELGGIAGKLFGGR
jgi:hypothetical protein